MFRKFDDWKAAADAALLARWGIDYDTAGADPITLKGYHYDHLTDGQTVQALADEYGGPEGHDFTDPDPYTAKALAQRHRIPGDPGAFTYLQCEAALCVWEEINERTLLSKAGEHSRLKRVRESYGSYALRAESVRIGCAAERVWEMLDEETRDQLGAFDWEFIPQYLSLCEWPEEWRGSDFADLPEDADAVAKIAANNKPE